MKNIIAVILYSLTFNNVAIAEYSDDSTIKNNPSYQATITRDIWGVPHVYGKRDEDAAFGLAYAHADDDIKNIAENKSHPPAFVKASVVHIFTNL